MRSPVCYLLRAYGAERERRVIQPTRPPLLDKGSTFSTVDELHFESFSERSLASLGPKPHRLPIANLTPRGPQRRAGQKRRVLNVGPLGVGERRGGDRRRGNDRRATAWLRWGSGPLGYLGGTL